MGTNITWDGDIIGSAIVSVAPTTTRDIANSYDGTQYETLVLALDDGNMAGESVDITVHRWNGSHYSLTGETFTLDNDNDAMVQIGGGFYVAVTGTYTGGGAWAVQVGYLQES